MPGLKVCGITDAGFALDAARRGADYLGFVFAWNSPRRIAPQAAHDIAQAVKGAGNPPRLVGVFTDQGVEDIISIGAIAGLDAIQLHGPYPDSSVVALKAKGYEVWRLSEKKGIEDAVLLDGRSGNESRKADWSKVAPLKAAGARVVLAGGISSANIADAVKTGADIIDVSSSLETSPGVKSLARLESLLESFRA